MKKLILLVLILASFAHAEPKRGLDPLGLAKQDAKIIANQIDSDSAIGFLDVTFGDPYPNLQKIVATGKVSAVRVHLGDGTPMNHGCTDKLRDLQYLKKGAKRFKQFCDSHSNIECFISPWLEHGCKDKALVERWYDVLRTNAPAMRYVCSAYLGYCPSNVIIEKHGNTVSAPITSNDGASVYDSNTVQYRNSGSLLTLAWSNCDNGRTTGEKTFAPISKRVDWCNRFDYIQKVRLMRPPAPMPNVPGCKPFTGKELLKTNAEYYGKEKDDGRGNKPLLILPKQYSRISIQRLDGQEVACAKYYGPFSGGGYRHYVGSCSGDNPIQLMGKLTSEWGLAKAGNQCWYFNAIRRQGYYH